MADPTPASLKGASEREAVDSMRGYSYQILRSMEAWIDLADGEVLVLEGAEDLDRLGDDGRPTAEQVKDTAGSGNVTLRSANVLEAIGNLWEHKERNPGVPIRFRFLTTSGVGREKSRPLGFEEPGLEAWRLIQAAPSSAESHRLAAGIQSFLKDQTALPKTMRAWLATVSTQEFIDRAVIPIEWVTGWPAWQDLHARVLAKLVELADRRDIGAADAAKALDALYAEAWKVATTKGRRELRRGDLLAILERAGTTAVPNRQLLAILGTITGAPGHGPLVTAAAEPFSPAPRPLPDRHPRRTLEGSIRTALASGTVLIHGGTGMGKTGLALASTGGARPVAWAGLRGMSQGAAASRIETLAARLPQLGQARDVVLDDLPASGDPRALEAPLGRLRVALDGLNAALLITAADRLPARLAVQLSLDGAHTFHAPAFDEQDIREYLMARGCPEDDAETWSKIIRVSTWGHPQFVDARVAALADGGFPKPDISELMAPRPEILDVRAEARRLVSALPEVERELLARASLTLGRTPRARLMAIAAIDPPIPEPGDVIDRLTGPWLERTDTDDLRPSPLLGNLGVDTRGQDWATRMHRGIAFSFLQGGSLLASDIFEIATHAILARTAAPLIPVLPGLLQASAEVWSQVAETASMLTYFGIGDGQAAPFDDPNDVAAFRVLQLRIAIEASQPDQVRRIVDRSVAEFDRNDVERNPGPGLFEVVFLWQLLQRPGELPLAERLRLSLRFAKVGDRLSKVLGSLEERGGGDDVQWPDLAPFLPMTLIPVVSDVDGLTELLDLIEQLEPADTARALGGYAGDGEAAALALDRVWLGEARREDPRWLELAAALRRVLTMSEEWDVPALSGAAAPLLVRVLDENLKDPDGALAEADKALGEHERPSRVLAAKARVLWRQGPSREALAFYEEAIASFPLGLSWRTDVMRDAAIAAGKVGDWPLAARRLTDALSGMSEDEPLVRHIGFGFDLAIALHLSGRTRDAVDRLGRAVDLMAEDGRPMPPEPLVSVRQLGSQVIRTIGAERGTSGIWGEDEMPLTRLFGSTSGLEELTWGEQRPGPLDVVILLMAELDLLMPEHPAIAERMAQRLRVSSNLLAQSTQGDMLTRLAVRTLDVSDGAADALREARALDFAASERDAGRDAADLGMDGAPATISPRWQELVKYRLLARVVALVARGRAADIPVSPWSEAMPTDGSMGDVIAMLDDLQRLIEGTEDASARIVGGNPTWDRHLLAALLAPMQRHLAPDQLLVCHVVAARYLLQAKLSEFTGAAFAGLVTGAWLDRCEHPAQLVAPRITVPDIRRAATSGTPGWPRVLGVLEAARNAVSVAAARSVSDFLVALRAQVEG